MGAAVALARLNYAIHGDVVDDNGGLPEIPDPAWHASRAVGVLSEIESVAACDRGAINAKGHGAFGARARTCLDCGEIDQCGLHCADRMLCPHARGVYLRRNRARGTKAWTRHMEQLPRAIRSKFLGLDRHDLRFETLTLPQQGNPAPAYRVRIMEAANADYIQRHRHWCRFKAAVVFEGARSSAWWPHYDETTERMRPYAEMEALYLGDPRLDNAPPTRAAYRVLKREYQAFLARVPEICARNGYVSPWFAVTEIEPEKARNLPTLSG